jgi:hypothetical protein
MVRRSPAEVDELARHLGLRAGQRLLDIGTGRGWPGVPAASTVARSSVEMANPGLAGESVTRTEGCCGSCGTDCPGRRPS